MCLEIEDVPLAFNFVPQMTLTFDIQAPSSSFAIRVDKLVGKPQCEDGGAPHRCRAGGMTVLSLDRAPCQNSKNHMFQL
jgi:hypothetical protein